MQNQMEINHFDIAYWNMNVAVIKAKRVWPLFCGVSHLDLATVVDEVFKHYVTAVEVAPVYSKVNPQKLTTYVTDAAQSWLIT